MGQYFTALVERADSIKIYRYRGYMKLTEHSWISNEFTDAILQDIWYDGPARIAWIGDYADNYTFCPAGMKEEDYLQRYEAAWNDSETITKPNGKPKRVEHVTVLSQEDYQKEFGKEDLKDLCLVNLTKKRFMSFADYIAYDVEKRRSSLFPLSLLTAVGNGQGLGDYAGSCMKSVGSWAFDEINLVLDDEVPADFEKEQDVQFCIHGSDIAYLMFN